MRYFIKNPGTEEETRIEGADLLEHRERDDEPTAVTRLMNELRESVKASADTAGKTTKAARKLEKVVRRTASDPKLSVTEIVTGKVHNG